MLPKIIPPIRLGIKKTVRKPLVNLFPRVNNKAMEKAKMLTVITETIVNKAVYRKAY